MRLQNIVAIAVASMALAGCDLFKYDNFDPPTSVLTGEVDFNGAPLPLRGHVHEIAIWQIEPEYPLAETTSMPVYINQDGTFRGLLYNGTYEASLDEDGPWVPSSSRHQFVMNGSADITVPVQPYYTIQNETIVYEQPTSSNPGGSIRATFTVGQHNTTTSVQSVGVYVSPTNTVDRTNGFSISNGVRERSGSSIQSELSSNTPITITVPLPSTVHQTPSPEPREHVFVRVGVRVQSNGELAYTNVYRIDI